MDWLFAAARPRTTVTVDGREVVQGELLADGGFAYVYRGSDAHTSEAVAIRKVLLHDAETFDAARREIELLRRLPAHQHVVRFLGAEILAASMAGAGEGDRASGQVAVQLFEFCPGGTLLQRLERQIAARSTNSNVQSASTAASPGYCCPCLPQEEALKVLDASAAALAHLHSVGIVHYDMKSENLLSGSNECWKLGDFGSASENTFDLTGAPRRLLLEAEEFIHGRCTPIYRSPELADVHLRWPIGPKADVFALGCVLFAVLTGQHPFPMDSALGNIQARFTLPPEAATAYPEALTGWVRRLLAREPSQRPSAAEIVAEVHNFRTAEEVARCAAAAGDGVDREPSWVADFPQAAASDEVNRQPSWVADFSQAAADDEVTREPSWVADFSQATAHDEIAGERNCSADDFPEASPVPGSVDPGRQADTTVEPMSVADSPQHQSAAGETTVAPTDVSDTSQQRSAAQATQATAETMSLEVAKHIVGAALCSSFASGSLLAVVDQQTDTVPIAEVEASSADGIRPLPPEQSPQPEIAPVDNRQGDGPTCQDANPPEAKAPDSLAMLGVDDEPVAPDIAITPAACNQAVAPDKSLVVKDIAVGVKEAPQQQSRPDAVAPPSQRRPRRLPCLCGGSKTRD